MGELLTRRGTSPCIACLHTAASNIDVFAAAAVALGVPNGGVRHAVRADLLADAERAGGPNPAILARTAAALAALAADADAVLLTCSTLGEAADAPDACAVPVLRVDRALAETAVQGGGRVVALCAAPTTRAPTEALFAAAARATGATVEVRLVADAWEAFKSGDLPRYHALVADAAERASRAGADRVALAQASMAAAAALVLGVPAPLTSPAVGLAAAWRAAGGEGRVA